MARIVTVMCDVHLEQGERVEAEELPPISIEGKAPRVLALCEEHKRDFYDPFAELVEDLAHDAEDDEPRPLPDDVRADDPADSSDAEGDKDEDEGDDREDHDRDDDQYGLDDPDEVIEETPSMSVVPGEEDTAEWACPVDDCDKSYTASGDTRAEDLKRLGNLHLSTAHHLDKAARVDLLSA